MLERIEKLTMDWFLTEPALLKVLMSHTVTENADMQCPVRCGNRLIEYNPALCTELSDKAFAETMKTECLRILLKHPYERKPDNCSPTAITLGSDCVVADNYSMKFIELHSPKDFKLKSGEYFEYYAKEIDKILPPQQEPSGSDNSEDKENTGNASGEGNSEGGSTDSGNETDTNNAVNAEALKDQSSLWKEDAMAAAEVNELIQKLEASNQWGSLSGSLVWKIIASTKARIDYRRVLQLFRTEVLSSMRRLTRMRPNRRSGFQNYGSVYRLTSRLLVAVDVSGSTTDDMVSEFFGIINRFFKYGIEDIDVIQFDASIKGEPISLKKAQKGEINILGRGGTNFQPIFNFATEQKHKYQGLIILTDGYAPEIELPDYFNTPVLWVLPDEMDEQNNWLSHYGKVCVIKR